MKHCGLITPIKIQENKVKDKQVNDVVVNLYLKFLASRCIPQIAR